MLQSILVAKLTLAADYCDSWLQLHPGPPNNKYKTFPRLKMAFHLKYVLQFSVPSKLDSKYIISKWAFAQFWVWAWGLLKGLTGLWVSGTCSIGRHEWYKTKIFSLFITDYFVWLFEYTWFYQGKSYVSWLRPPCILK